MKKLISGIDLFAHIALLLVGSAYIIFQNNYFASQLFAICWLPFSIYTVFGLANLKEFPNLKQSLYSILNLVFLGVLIYLEKLILIEFFLSTILAEMVAISLAISYFFLFGKGLNDVKASDLFGKKQAAFLAVLFTALIYPYIGEMIIYIESTSVSIFLVVAFAFTLIFGVIRQVKSIQALVERKNKNPEKVDKELEEALKGGKPLDFDAKVILINLALWFFGIGTIWAIYVHNA